VAEQADPGRVDPDREALLGVLTRHRVAFVLIGGAAIQSYGRSYDTQDIDLTPDTTPENLARLADAMNELRCRLITDPSDTASWVRLPPDYFTARSLLAASVWNLATELGQLDICFTPTGFPGGYRDLHPRSNDRPAAGTTVVVSVAALEDVHESKRQADRPKDRAYLERGEETDAS
jgi:hypothetical protein